MAKPVTATGPRDDPQIILTVAAAKAELKVPESVDLDSDLIPQINGAAAWVGGEISAPVLDVEHMDVIAPQPPGKMVGSLPWRVMPVTVFERRWVRDVVKVEWWDEDGDLSDEPNQTILRADLGRIEVLAPGPMQDAINIFPGAEGWPTEDRVLPGSVIRIHTIAGLDMTTSYAEIVQRAVVAGVQQLNGGYPAIRYNSTIENVVGSLRPMAV